MTQPAPLFLPLLSRRRLMQASLLAFGTAGFVASTALAQTSPAPGGVDLAALYKPGALGDKVLGKADAPVTIVEYASFTCSHCATFHKEGLPELKKRYIDTGKAKLIFREFPFDPLSVAASMLARCASEARYFPFADALFAQQVQWTQTDKPLDALLSLARQAGFTQESFEACLKNEAVFTEINAEKTRGAEQFKVNSTPTFFINGTVLRGNQPIEEFAKIIDPMLPK